MAMVTSSGGVAVLLADALEPRGFAFAPLAGETVRRVEALLPPYVTVGNPLDITAGLPDETFGEVLATVARDPGIDVVVVPLTMASAGRGLRARRAGRQGGARSDEADRGLLARRKARPRRVPGARTRQESRSSPRPRAARPRSAPPSPSASSRSAHRAAGRRIAAVAAPEGSGALPWRATAALLASAGLRLAPEVIVRDEVEARAAAPGIRYPVAVKVLGPLHRTDVGGVRLGVSSLDELVAAVRELRPLGEACLVQPMVEGVEVLVGAVRDPELGPFVLVAPGGVRAELYGERAMTPAPCDEAAADALIRDCRALDALLGGHRGGRPADRAALVETVTRAAALAAGLGPRLAALDLNPVIVGPPGGGAIVVDARIMLDP